MPSTPSTLTRLEEMAVGEKSATWGPITSTNLNLLEQATHGVNSFTLSGSKTLTTVNYATDEARKKVLNITGGTGGTLTVPNLEHVYVVRNGSTGNVILTAGTGAATATIPTLTRTVCFCDGSDEIYAIDTTDLWTYHRVATNFTHATSSFADVTGAQFDIGDLTDDQEYELEGTLYVKISSGSVIVAQAWPAGLTDGVSQLTINAGSAIVAAAGNITTNPVTLAATAVGTAYRPAFFKGHIIPTSGSSGDVKFQVRASAGTPTITVRAGSFLKYRRTYP